MLTMPDLILLIHDQYRDVLCWYREDWDQRRHVVVAC